MQLCIYQDIYIVIIKKNRNYVILDNLKNIGIEIEKDELKNFEKKIQNSTDKQTLELEKKLEEKEKEIMII